MKVEPAVVRRHLERGHSRSGGKHGVSGPDDGADTAPYPVGHARDSRHRQLWDAEHKRGWIVATETGEEFFCTPDSIVGAEEIDRDDIVYFVPFGVAADGKCRVATGTIYLGQEVEAVVARSGRATGSSR